MSEPESESSRLGSLAQSARSKQLNTARGILLFIGIVIILFNGFQMTMVRNEVKKGMDQAIRQHFGPGAQVDAQERQNIEDVAVVFGYLICGAFIFLGVLYLIFALVIKLFPVPVTIASLVLFICTIVVNGLLNQASLTAGLIIKIFIIVALSKAIQSAIAYQRAEKSAALQASLAEE